MSTEHSFLFTSLDSKQPSTARKVHIRRLFDILHLSLQRNDLVRARRAWVILARCKETHWKSMWKTALLLLGAQAEDGMDADDTRINFLTTMMRQHADERESILKELVLQLIHAGQYRKALDELELFLPSLPYQDNPVLHVYAGLICLYLAQPKANALIADELSDESGWNAGLLREAQGHFERAKAIDADNTVATTFLEQV
ncbi:hypothetical protein BKA93DRAFT_816738 [Sparassis latifolia]